MPQTITLSQSEYEKLLARISRLEESIRKLLKGEPVYGSDEWWEREIKEGLKEAKAGKGVVLQSAKEIDEYFDRLDAEA